MRDNTRMPELLAPAGNLEKLKFACDYGANAVYCSLDKFGMRSFADNFSPEEMREGIAYAHARDVRVYCTLNTMPRDDELSKLPEYLETLKEIAPDAFIISDFGVLELVKEKIKDAVIHISTQASTVNSGSVNFWYKQGARRIVLARELSVSEIAEIRRNVPEDMELECFVHGAMCVSYSGRCLLSNYFTGRSANEGKCAQPCRWKYYLREESRGECAVACGDENGTYLMSSRDMNMVEHLADLIDAGVDSLKIEGRMKSAYYTAAVTNAYRIALDNRKGNRPFDPRCRAETESVSHREYGTGYFYSSPHTEPNTVRINEYISERRFLCTVVGFDSETHLAECIQKNKMCVGDKANILSPHTFGRDITINELFDADMNPIDSTPHAKMRFFLRTDFAARGDIIRGE